ncbi:MAG TPA: hypothetical protein VF071_04305 [Candidatus Limnocylindria bacterium]
MTGETVECYNCGRANPAWAQVCRSCGVPIRPGVGKAAASGPIPQDRDSLISMGAILASIAAAVVLGLILSGMIPEAPVAVATPSPEPSRTPRPTRSFEPSGAPSGEASADPTPALIGTVTFGTGINNAEEATGVTDTFGPGANFCHSVALSEPFGVDVIQEEVIRVEEDGSLTEVQPRADSNLRVDAAGQIAGFCAPGGTDSLLADWGAGSFILRDYRNPDEPELVAEGRFTLTE